MSVVRYQVGAPEDAAPPSMSNLAPEGAVLATSRVVGGAVSVQADGTVNQTGTHSVNTADLGNCLEGALGTARTKTGSPRMGELQPTDVVTIGGMEMSVQVAERLGMLTRDKAGALSENPEAAAEPPQETSEDPAVALPNQAAEQELASMCQTVDAGTQVHALGQLIQHGELDPTTLGRVASGMGVDLDVASGRLETVIEGFREQASQTVKALGSDDPSFFFEWAQKARPNQLQDAMRSHAMERSVDGYRSLYRAYVEDLGDSDPDFVLNADHGDGMTAQKVGNKVVLNVPGHGQIEYRTAVRMGIINMRGA